MKFSDSVLTHGLSNRNNRIITIRFIKSLIVNWGENIIFFILKMFDGLEEPVKCSENMCTITITTIIIGSKKCKQKKNMIVILLTLKPPHTHITIVVPSTGITEKNFVITVAAQKDICPQGNT